MIKLVMITNIKEVGIWQQKKLLNIVGREKLS